jgi:hypothetical protein
MLRRLGLLVILLIVGASLVVSAEADAYWEGVYIGRTTAASDDNPIADVIRVCAEKSVDGDWRQTVVRFYYTAYDYNTGQYTRQISTTAVLYEDPDGLEVSDDLGWGGLDGQIVVFDQVDGQNHIVQFHMTTPASQRAYSAATSAVGRVFSRPAYLEGYILLDGELLSDFNRTEWVWEHAKNLSDQWPGY